MKAGFTLVELLIVIAIICLLMVSISPFLRGNQDQALLSRQADIVRQGYFETVMRAKTGAAEAGITSPGELLRGFLVSTTAQEIRPLAFPTLSFEEAKTKNIPALIEAAGPSNNLLLSDAGHQASAPLAKLSDLQLQPNNRTTGAILILMEAVSNDVAVVTDQGPATASSMTFTLSDPQSTRLMRKLTIHPDTGLININE